MVECTSIDYTKSVVAESKAPSITVDIVVLAALVQWKVQGNSRKQQQLHLKKKRSSC